jgi:hypothetical protein
MACGSRFVERVLIDARVGCRRRARNTGLVFRSSVVTADRVLLLLLEGLAAL